jgi:hypothetical protein
MKVKRIHADGFGKMKLYAYICKNLVKANKRESYIFFNFDRDKADNEENEYIKENSRKRGIFILLSSIQMPPDKILPFLLL